MPVSIASVVFTFGRGANKLALAQFRLNEHNHQVLVNMNVPNENINFLEQWLNDVVRAAENQDVTQSLCAVLEQAFRIISLSNSNDEEFEYLAIMVIDGTLTLGNNLLVTSRNFNRRRITLAIVAHITPVFQLWDAYRTLAQNTGGAIMLEKDAPVILKHVILSTINEEHTLHQAFQHIHQESVAMANAIDDMKGQEQPEDGDDDLVFDMDLSE